MSGARQGGGRGPQRRIEPDRGEGRGVAPAVSSRRSDKHGPVAPPPPCSIFIWMSVVFSWVFLLIFTILGALALTITDPPKPRPTSASRE